MWREHQLKGVLAAITLMTLKMERQIVYAYLMARYCRRNLALVKYYQGLPPLTEEEIRESMRVIERVLGHEKAPLW